MSKSKSSLDSDQAGSTAPVVQIRDVHKSFGTTEVLKGISLDVNRAEVVVILGPSGSGKTTLLRCVNALESYDRGSLKVDGVEIGFQDLSDGRRRRRGERELSPIRADIGMVFQLFYLFPHLSALENVMLGLRKVRRQPREEARETAKKWLERVGLEDKIDSLPAQLSGGQQQRVGIARAVAMDPKVLLLDEVTSALDPELVGEVLAVVRDLAELGMTMMCVTHEVTFAREVADRVVFMDAGVIQAAGSADELLVNPRHERLKTFLARFH